MTKYLGSRSLGLTGVIAVMLAGATMSPALAKDAPAAVVDTSMCFDPVVSQPFASLSDMNWYALAPGQTSNSFTGTGWTLASGARIVTARLADGQAGSVLDLPAGSQAVSPPMCVAADYPTARTLVQTTGAAKLAFAVSYAGSKSADRPKTSGNVQAPHDAGSTGWSASDQLDLHPGKPLGWQIVRLYFTAQGNSGDAQIYDVYVDPRMKR